MATAVEQIEDEGMACGEKRRHSTMTLRAETLDHVDPPVKHVIPPQEAMGYPGSESDDSHAMTLRVESLALIREKMQKKTFGRWCNMSLEPRHQITDLFEDLKTGEKLLELVNILSETTTPLQPERGHMEIHHRQNIARALTELEKVDPSHGISISAIYEGNPKLTLALVWHLILRFSHLHGNMEKGINAEIHCKEWCSNYTDGYVGLSDIRRDFLGCWVNGLLLPAIINRYRPDLLDYEHFYYNLTPAQRFEESFTICEKEFGVPQLLDVEDMERMKVDDQSIVTYVMYLNKALTDDIPVIPEAVVELKERVRKEQQLDEKLEDESNEEDSEDDIFAFENRRDGEIDTIPNIEPEVQDTVTAVVSEDISFASAVAPEHISPDHVLPDHVSPDHISPDHVSPQLISPDHVLPDHISPDHVSPDHVIPPIKSPQSVSPDDDKDSGLELEYSPTDVPNQHDQKTASSASPGAEPPPPPHRLRSDTAASHGGGGGGGGVVTVDSEAEYISATSSPALNSRHQVSDGDYDSTENIDMIYDSSNDMTPTEDTILFGLSASPVDDAKHFENILLAISSFPEDQQVSKEYLDVLLDDLLARRQTCHKLQEDIKLQLNTKQRGEKRAELHNLLSQTGRFDDVLSHATLEVKEFKESLDQFEKALQECQEFAEIAETHLSEVQLPKTATDCQAKLIDQCQLRQQLEDGQRQLELSLRSLNRSCPKVVAVSIQDQQKQTTMVQNKLSDIEGVINGTIETLEFLCSRLPSLEQKLKDADDIITRVEDNADEFDSGSNPDNLQLQIERAQTHLATVEHLFLAIESFNNEFSLEDLRTDWRDLASRCDRAASRISELFDEEENLSEEVIAISEWAETLESFLQRKIKPIESQVHLQEVLNKWKEVGEDLDSKYQEIENLLERDCSTPDSHRIMSPLDKDTLCELREQLVDLKQPLQTRKELLYKAYNGWNIVDAHIRSLSENLMELEFRFHNAVSDHEPEANTIMVRPMLRYACQLSRFETDLGVVSDDLIALVEEVSDLPATLIDTDVILHEREMLYSRHVALCKLASDKRVSLQRRALTAVPTVPFLREPHHQTLSWLYRHPLPDMNASPDRSSKKMLTALSSPDSVLKSFRLSDYWHSLRVIAPEKIPFAILTWVAFAIGPWGLGCQTDRPLNIYEVTPSIRI